MRGQSSFEPFRARLSDFIRRSGKSSVPACADTFDSLALELFVLQFNHNQVYRKFCEARGALPKNVEHWSRIPAVPTESFKEYDLSCIPPEERAAVFHSSGTTTHRPSRHFHNAASLALYEDSLLSGFRANLTSGISDFRLLFLTPSPQDAPHSSLVHMFDTIRREARQPGTDGFHGRVGADGGWELDNERIISALHEIRALGAPAFLFGTAFSFVHLLDYLAQNRLKFALPDGSRALETGGYKGRSRSLNRPELHSLIHKLLGISPTQIQGEYGMSELSSQAYDSIRYVGSESLRIFSFPPWTRIQIISAETQVEVREGESGLVRIFDLANTYSVMAIQTEDLAIRHGKGFELLGRSPLAETRGCSLMSVEYAPSAQP